MTTTLRLRTALGYAVTAVSAFATIATSSAPDQTVLSLPDKTATLGPSAPETRQRFRVETDNGKFDLDLQFATEQDATPTLQVHALDDAEGNVKISSPSSNVASPRLASLRTSVETACVNGFPCTVTLEVVATAALAATETVTGTQSTSVNFNSSFRDDAYLAIEPL